ncbi:MAG: hypothetical protein PHN80_01620 [Hespellia sp.]|nr:hypothetical protein [Hespellia sp.]
MKRFYKGRKEHNLRNAIISVLLFCAVFSLFFYGTNTVSAKTDAQQAQSLNEAIHRGITHCYAVEGRYPESLDYLKKEYGISYDEDKYFVDYQVLGTNLMPDVTIINK